MPLSAEEKITKMLEAAGCQLNGPNPWDPQVHDESAYGRLIRGGALAAGETYMDGLWDCERLDILVDKIGGAESPVQSLGKATLARAATAALFQNLQSPRRARHNAEHHYNIGNDLYVPMLGKTMAYSCAYWKDVPGKSKGDPKYLDQAQEAKFDLICRKLGLQPGMRVLEIGCGWGGPLSYAMRKYGVEGVGITPASEQVAYIKKHHPKIKVRRQDWREVTGQYDRVYSIGMFEHVGPKNYRGYFDKVKAVTKPGGMSLLHTIGAPRTRLTTDPWITKYIFPGGHIPSEAQIRRASKATFDIADWHEMGTNYDHTLMAWHANFQKAWPDISDHYDERFKRMWQYYLLICAGSFRNQTNLLFQAVMTDHGAAEGYTPVR